MVVYFKDEFGGRFGGLWVKVGFEEDGVSFHVAVVVSTRLCQKVCNYSIYSPK